MTKRRTLSRAAFEATYFPGSTRLAPGLWTDGAGDLHVSIPELLALVDLEDTPENREEARRTVEAWVQRAMPDTTIVHSDPD